MLADTSVQLRLRLLPCWGSAVAPLERGWPAAKADLGHDPVPPLGITQSPFSLFSFQLSRDDWVVDVWKG